MTESVATSSAPSARRQYCQKSPRPRFDHARRTISVQPGGMFRAEVVETEASSTRATADACERSPAVQAPPPRSAHQRRPSAGAETSESSTRPSRSNARSVAQIGTPRT
jgi:hypothetical protein